MDAPLLKVTHDRQVTHDRRSARGGDRWVGKTVLAGHMKFSRLVFGAVIAQGLALLSSPAAHAHVILTYTGNDFTFFIVPYTSTDKVTASITLANPLGDNLNLAPVTPRVFSLSDGVRTLSEVDPSISGIFEFSTNAAGMITEWDVEASRTGGPANFIATQDVPGMIIDIAVLIPVGSHMGSVLNDPGVWTASSAAVPEPPTVSVLGAGLLGLGLLWWHRRSNWRTPSS
jgi:MYXO-CTERM domain-containing protein